MNHHENPATLARAIGQATDLVTSVSYLEDEPNVWAINTRRNIYFLGDSKGFFEWQDATGEVTGETLSTEPKAIAQMFGIWLDELEG